MPKALNSLDDHVQDTLDARRRTQSGRFQPLEPGTERVADVLLSSCAAVAAAFAEFGFRWSKSKLHFSRKIGSFTHIISFQGDVENSSGSHVGVSIHAQAKCTDLGKWREANGVATGDNLWITQIGYLSSAHEYLKWQLVDPATRQAEVDSMVKTIHELAMPAFEVCSTKESLSSRLLERREMTWIPDWAVDIAVWVGNKSAADALIRSRLSKLPDVTEQFNHYIRVEASKPSLSRPENRIHRLAWVAKMHRLHVQTSA